MNSPEKTPNNSAVLVVALYGCLPCYMKVSGSQARRKIVLILVDFGRHDYLDDYLSKHVNATSAVEIRVMKMAMTR